MPEVVIETKESLEAYIKLGKGKIVTLFTAPSWCGPCRQFHPHWNRAVETEEDITFLYVDIDNVEGADVEYGIRSVPTVFMYEKGEYVKQIKAPQGAMPFIADIRS